MKVFTHAKKNNFWTIELVQQIQTRHKKERISLRTRASDNYEDTVIGYTNNEDALFEFI